MYKSIAYAYASPSLNKIRSFVRSLAHVMLVYEEKALFTCILVLGQIIDVNLECNYLSIRLSNYSLLVS